GARSEIWAFGFRNPWKLSFNEKNGELWIGDVGWELYEMVYLVKRGGNYGWSVMEGPQPVRGEIEPGPGPILPPIADHHHVESKSVTGGHVYRGKRLKSLAGAYIYGDYVTGKIWGLKNRGDEVTWHEELASSSLQVIAFGRDREQNFYVLDYAGGIYRLAENPDKNQNSDFPRKLSQTGLFTSTADQHASPGVVPFTVASHHWSDHATASYLVGVPGQDPITLEKGVFSFPEGTVLAKTLSTRTNRTQSDSNRVMETQLLLYQGGQWDAYTYAWNEDQTDAELVSAKGTERVLKITDPGIPGGSENYSWRYHSRAECLTCHNTRHNQLIGFLVPQLNHETPAGRQLDILQQSGLVRWAEWDKAAADKKPSSADLPSLANPQAAEADLAARARSYLFTNCAHCHMPGGGGTATIDLRHEVTLELTKTIGAKPSQGNFLLQDARIIAPGDPTGSVLLYRISKTGSGHMPHIGPSLVDTAAVNLLGNWISGMPREETSLITRRMQEKQQSEQFVDAATGEDDRRKIAESLLATSSGALALSVAMQDNPVDPALVNQIARDRPLHISDLFDRYLLPGQRTERLGSVINPDQILRLRGSQQRGRQLFVQEATVQCRNCHQLGGAGKQVGRDLSDVGIRLTRNQILESILYPSRKIEPAYSSYIVETVDGRILTGLLKSKDEQQLVLVTVDAKEVTLATEDVDLLVRQPKSLMPDLLLRDLTAQQVADLLAFLVSQKKPPAAP
ncbi:MAG: PQQ-dependent sugar dehydrogenase, partial [Planctomycetota bacterium]|nr:PQQ-dependent sugar dehydrogenase [Planctomycetota bacterium]MEE2990024.1 PQQ-dependent sugar dehydrogenase [Planctomycetota bacterium]